jgi:hypothetical protein
VKNEINSCFIEKNYEYVSFFKRVRNRLVGIILISAGLTLGIIISDNRRQLFILWILNFLVVLIFLFLTIKKSRYYIISLNRKNSNELRIKYLDFFKIKVIESRVENISISGKLYLNDFSKAGKLGAKMILKIGKKKIVINDLSNEKFIELYIDIVNFSEIEIDKDMRVSLKKSLKYLDYKLSNKVIDLLGE